MTAITRTIAQISRIHPIRCIPFMRYEKGCPTIYNSPYLRLQRAPVAENYHPSRGQCEAPCLLGYSQHQPRVLWQRSQYQSYSSRRSCRVILVLCQYDCCLLIGEPAPQIRRQSYPALASNRGSASSISWQCCASKGATTL